MTASDIQPSDDVPEDIAAALDGCSDAELRSIVHYAQRLLREHPSLTDEIESRTGEDLVRVEDYGAYSIVVVERPDETGEARGPFAYRVNWAPDMDGEGGKYRWHYLGKVHGDSEDD